MRQDIIDLYDDFTHGRISRRSFMDRLVALTGGAAAAIAALALLQPDRAAAAMVAAEDSRLTTETVAIADGPKGYLVRPAAVTGPLPGLVILHENRGLNGYIEDVARRAALEGFMALAPDLLTAWGGTPSDPDKARDMIAALPMADAVAQARASIGWLRARKDVNGKVGILGFCWGGSVAGQVTVAEPALDAAVIFYGMPPESDQVAKIKAPLLLHYAGLDQRTDAKIPAFRQALDAAGVHYELYMYEGANHAFHNDTSAERYDPEAAKLAWQRSIEFLKRMLG